MRLLGKAPVKRDPRNLMLAAYAKALPPPPESVDWSAKAGPLGMMLNDQIGDCTCAAAGHLIQTWTGNARPPAVIPPDADIRSAYSAITGYDPATGQNDNGAFELDVLKYWRSTGIAGDKIAAFASVNPQDLNEVKTAIALFGGIYIGLELPISAENQAVWSYLPGNPNSTSRSWGGHAVCCVGYNSVGPTCITWGALKQMTWRFFEVYCSEAYALLTQDWISDSGKSPSGFDLAALQADLSAVGRMMAMPPAPAAATGFHGQPKLSPLPASECDGAQIWTLLEDFTYISPALGAITAPAGMKTDLASVPRAAWALLDPQSPIILYGSIIHDYLYSVTGVLPDGREVTKDMADSLLREMMLACGASHFVAETVYLAVRQFGGPYWNRKN